MNRRSVTVVGSLNVDWALRVPRFPEAGETVQGDSLARYPGGKGANQAAAAARTGSAVSVSMVGQVGADEPATWLLGQLAAAGVDVSRVGVDATVETGTALIAVDAEGQNRIVVVPGANGTFWPNRLNLALGTLREGDLVLLQNEIPAETVWAAARTAHAHGATVVLDPAPARPASDELLGLCTYLTPNESELRALLGEPYHGEVLRLDEAISGARRLRARGARNVVVKLGAQGAALVGEAGEQHWAAPSSGAVDTTAAGDVWNGAFAAALAERMAIAMAGAFANAAAALSVSRHGAQSSIPSRAEVDEVLAAIR